MSDEPSYEDLVVVLQKLVEAIDRIVINLMELEARVSVLEARRRLRRYRRQVDE